MPIISGFGKSGPGAKESKASLGYVRPNQGEEGEESKLPIKFIFSFLSILHWEFSRKTNVSGIFFSYEIYLKTL